MERRRKQDCHQSSENSCPCIAITVVNRQTALKIATASVRKLVNFFLNCKQIACQEISVLFVGKRKITEIHGQFFNDPTPTDCMTFPIDNVFLGECVICPKVAIEVNPEDPYEETSLYLIHCLLHLIGYDDIDKDKRRIMHREQKKLLKAARKSECLLRP
jgi:probable rRNA maturation factor